MRMADKRSGTGRSAVMAMGQVVGLSCRWLDGAVRQQCAGHLPFERQARANGGFSVRRTGTTDPDLPDDVCKVEVCFLIFKLPAVSSNRAPRPRPDLPVNQREMSGGNPNSRTRWRRAVPCPIAVLPVASA